MEVDEKALTALTTEHFGLAGARSQAASESASRSALYVGSVSSALVGLGLVAQLPHEKAVFYAFALTALPTLFFLGTFTFIRLVELGIEDFLLGRAINRIRHLYIEIGGEASRYFLLSGNDDSKGVLSNMGIEPSGWQLFFTAAMAVAVVNAVVGGAAVAVAVGRIFGSGLGVCCAAGGVLAVVVLAIAIRFQRSLRDAGTHNESLFPSTEAERREVPPPA